MRVRIYARESRKTVNVMEMYSACKAGMGVRSKGHLKLMWVMHDCVLLLQGSVFIFISNGVCHVCTFAKSFKKNKLQLQNQTYAI